MSQQQQAPQQNAHLFALITEQCGVGPDEPPMSDVQIAVIHLLNVAVPDFKCLMCGQDREEHADDCPIWRLEQWI